MHLSSPQKKAGLPLIVLVVLLLAGWQFGWLDREPRHQGKTVTEWLDSLVLYTYETESNGDVVTVSRLPDEIVIDPAFQALQAIGSRGVPVLMERIAEPAGYPPEMSHSERWKVWFRWKLYRLRGGKAARPVSGRWSEIQKARKTAAGFVLLGLGTNAHAGFPRFMEAYATAPQFTSTYGANVTGMPVGIAPSSVVRAAVSALPQRREEIVAQVLAGLRHTNAVCRQSAVQCARVFPEELLKHKQILVSLTRDTNALVQESALGSLILIVQHPLLTNLMSPSEIRQVAQAVIEAPGSTQRVRDLARWVVSLADAPATK